MFLNFIFSLYKGNTNIGNDGLKNICKGIKSNPGVLEQIKMNLGNILSKLLSIIRLVQENIRKWFQSYW